MAVTFDAVGPSSAGAAFTATPGTWTHVNGGNGILVGVTIFNGGTNTVTGVTYGGTTVPFLGFIPGNNGTAGGIALYGLVGATCPTGSNTVSVAFSDGGANHNAGSVSVAGAGSLGTPVTNFATVASVSVTVTVTGTTTGGLIVSAASYGSQNAFVADGNSTIRWSRLTSSSSGSDNGVMGTTTDPGGGASRTVTWTTNPTNPDFWGVVAVEVLPPASGTDTSPAWAASQDTTAAPGAGTWTNPGNATGAADGSFATWAAP
jgi:hypothetical protein